MNKDIRALICTALLIALAAPVISSADSIQLPRTGQKTCYDSAGIIISCAGTGQEGDYKTGVAWPEPRFAVTGDCVTDNLTGLMWTKNGNPAEVTKTWQGAIDYVASLNDGSGLCNYTDWRLPNVNELESLLNYEEPVNAIWLNTQGFTNVIETLPGFYWSSTTHPDNPDNAWLVHMYDEHVYDKSKSLGFYVWPVRSGQTGDSNPMYPANIWKTGQTTVYYGTDDGASETGVSWPNPRFTAGGDCVTDNLTGLMWTKDANRTKGPKSSWQAALNYASDINSDSGICGYTDWRLPNRRELLSLVDRSRYSPALPENHPFTHIQSDYYISSTTSAFTTQFSWRINMADGYLSDFNKYNSGYVWLARAGMTGTSCAGSLSPGLTLHLPAVTFSGQSYWAHFEYVTGTLDFLLTNAGLLTDTSAYSDCASSTLSSDFQLHIPELIYSGVSYRADLRYSEGQTFTVTGSGRNY